MAYQPFGQFWAQGPSFEDILSRGMGKSADYTNAMKGQPMSQWLSNAYGNLAVPMSGFGNMGTYAAYANLADILMGRGQTDPRRMNMMQADIARGTEGQVGQIRDQMARRGLSNSGIGMAMEQGARQGGENQQARLQADEAALAEQRRRGDLDLFIRMLLQPSMDQAAMAMGQYNADRSANNQQKGAELGAISQLLAALLG